MNLFSQLAVEPTHEELYPGAVLMRGLALEQDAEFFRAAEGIIAAAPLRHATTPGGLPMQVMVTDCGTERAFQRRYDSAQRPPAWRPIPRVLEEFAIRCAVRSGFPLFRPDSCHINRYQAGTKLGAASGPARGRFQPADCLALIWAGVHVPAGRSRAHRRGDAHPAGAW